MRSLKSKVLKLEQVSQKETYQAPDATLLEAYAENQKYLRSLSAEELQEIVCNLQNNPPTVQDDYVLELAKASRTKPENMLAFANELRQTTILELNSLYFQKLQEVNE